MIKTDFHVHTSFCDGLNTPKEMVEKAISLGYEKIGLVCHAYTPCDESYCIKRENINKFIDEINGLKIKYKEKISVFCGVEFDYFADMDISPFDFVIGAVHYVFKDGNCIPVDESKQKLKSDVEKYYNGDFYSFAEDYFDTLSDIYSKTTPDFIAHLDLVSKFNSNGELFDENNERYVLAYKKCIDKLIKRSAVFEINYGGIIRGYKDSTYPSETQIDYILSNGGKIIVNSDAHSIYDLENAKKTAKAVF